MIWELPFTALALADSPPRKTDWKNIEEIRKRITEFMATNNGDEVPSQVSGMDFSSESNITLLKMRSVSFCVDNEQVQMMEIQL